MDTSPMVTSPVVTIRAAQSTDAALIWTYLQRKAAFDRSVGAFTGELNNSVERIEQTLFRGTPLAQVLFAEKASQPVGFALYALRYSSFAGRPSLWLDDLYVDEAERSNGIGWAVMQELSRLAALQDCTHLAWTADARNDAGLRFYRRLGAEVERQIDHRCYLRWQPSELSLKPSPPPQHSQLAPVVIRVARPDEDRVIARHFYQMWIDNGLTAEQLEPDWEAITLDYLTQARSDLGYQAFVAEVEGEIVGSAGGQHFAGLYPINFTSAFRRDGYIWGVYVEPAFRRQGLGKQLTEQVIAHLRSLGCTRAVLNASPSGRSVYEQLGFVPGNAMTLAL